ncbi:hypothetical protein FOA52_001518 [Chlamydomonas sp. UWO 241]|nr:hypothetical protein FOA52_001518 [Chlamydomonas sp. UWO 241]
MRDDARAQVLELQATIEGMREVQAARERELATAAHAAGAASAAAAAAAVRGSPAPAAAAAGTASPRMGANGMGANGEGGAAAQGPLGSLAQSLSMSSKTGGYAKALSDGMTAFGFGGGSPGSQPSGAHAATAAPHAPESEADRKMRELQAKQAAALAEKRRQEEERLLSSLSTDLGYNAGRPVAAVVVFRCCLQWRAFQAERTSLFDRITGVIGAQIERQHDDNGALAYWLVNTVTLLHLLQKNIKPASGGTKKSSARGVFDTLFGARTAVGPPAHNEASIHGGSVGGFKAVEAKYPALLFKQQLDAFVQKIFPLMRDNVKKAITPMLANCINTPKVASRGRAHDHTSAQQSMLKSWGDILGVMDALLETVKATHVPRPLVQALFKQLYAFVNVNLFNQLLLRRECCSFSNGENVRMGLNTVEQWLTSTGREYVADSWDELRWIRQAVQFLVIGNKQKRTLEEITADLCPVLSIQQLYRISTMYWDDRYNTETVSPDVLSRMKQQMTDVTSAATHSFLLDDDATLPFRNRTFATGPGVGGERTTNQTTNRNSAADVLNTVDPRVLAELNGGMPVPEALKGGDYSFLERELKIALLAA